MTTPTVGATCKYRKDNLSSDAVIRAVRINGMVDLTTQFGERDAVPFLQSGDLAPQLGSFACWPSAGPLTPEGRLT